MEMSASGLVQLWQVSTSPLAIIIIIIGIITIIITIIIIIITTIIIIMICNGTYFQVRSVDQGKSSPAAGSLSSQRSLTDIAMMVMVMVMVCSNGNMLKMTNQ